MKTMTLNKKLLSFILLFQAQFKLLLNRQLYEAHMYGEPTTNWHTELRDWYSNFPQADIDELGLVKNDYTFDALISLKVEDEWMNTPTCDLGRFTVTI